MKPQALIDRAAQCVAACQGMDDPVKEIERLRRKNAKLRREVRDLRYAFALEWRASQAAIDLWHKAHPSQTHVWPSHTKLLLWLMEQHNPPVESSSGPVVKATVKYLKAGKEKR